MKDFLWWMLAYILIPILVGVVVILLCRWTFNAVMSTDWPNWVKYLILRG